MGFPKKVALARPTTGLAKSVAGVAAPSGVTQAKPPIIDTQKKVGLSNVTKTRWAPPATPKKMGNH